VEDLEGANRLRPSPSLGDGLTDSWYSSYVTTVYCVTETPSPSLSLQTRKHGTRNIQNDCHQWLFGSFRLLECTKFVFGWGSAADPAGDSALPDQLAGLRGPTSKGEWKKEGKGREREGRAPALLTQIPGFTPDGGRISTTESLGLRGRPEVGAGICYETATAEVVAEVEVRPAPSGHILPAAATHRQQATEEQ